MPKRRTNSSSLDVLAMSTHYNALQRATMYCNVLQRAATRCNALQRTAMHGNALQRTATHGNLNALQHTATHCNTLQHTCDESSLYITFNNTRTTTCPACALARALRKRHKKETLAKIGGKPDKM